MHLQRRCGGRRRPSCWRSSARCASRRICRAVYFPPPDENLSDRFTLAAAFSPVPPGARNLALPRGQFEVGDGRLPGGAGGDGRDRHRQRGPTRPKLTRLTLFVEAARRLRVDPTRCLAFDESPAGVAGAQAAGMLSAAVGPGVAARFGSLAPEWLLRDICAFDAREIELPRRWRRSRRSRRPALPRSPGCCRLGPGSKVPDGRRGQPGRLWRRLGV